MARFTIGCQTYSWEMLGEAWKGTPDDILDAVARAGYTGVEFSNNMIGAYWEHPDQFQSALEKRKLKFAGFAYATTGFTDPAQFEFDMAGAEKALRFTAYFKVALGLGGPSSSTREHYDAKLAQAVRFYEAVTRRGRELGVVVAVHPHSHHTSLALTGEEYDRLLQATEAYGLMFNPDTGHILRGGQELMDCLRRYRKRIVHVHMKDVSAGGEWVPMGKGVTDTPGILRWLDQTGYSGWVVIEEESDQARRDVPAAIMANRAYIKSMGY